MGEYQSFIFSLICCVVLVYSAEVTTNNNNNGDGGDDVDGVIHDKLEEMLVNGDDNVVNGFILKHSLLHDGNVQQTLTNMLLEVYENHHHGRSITGITDDDDTTSSGNPIVKELLNDDNTVKLVRTLRTKVLRHLRKHTTSRKQSNDDDEEEEETTSVFYRRFCSQGCQEYRRRMLKKYSVSQLEDMLEQTLELQKRDQCNRTEAVSFVDITRREAHEYYVGDGFIVINDFLGSEADVSAKDVYDELRSLAVLFTPGEVGVYGRVPELRGDYNVMIDRPQSGNSRAYIPKAGSALAFLMEAMVALAELQLQDQTHVLDLGRTEFMASLFPDTGSRYYRHTDNRKDTAENRRFTMIYYPNSGWEPKNGGTLRMHISGQAIDIPPVADRLVIFVSTTIDHQVCDSYFNRYAISAFIR